MKTLPLLALLALAACHTTTDKPAATTDPKAAPGSAPVVASSPGCSYEVFRGLLPGQADSITLFLVRGAAANPEADASGDYGASYCTDAGHPYDLSPGTSHSPDSLTLYDTSYETMPANGSYGDGPVWRLLRQPDGTLHGTRAGQPLRLRPVPPRPNMLRFAVRVFTDSVAGLPERKNTPYGHVGLTALLPSGGPAAVAQALTANILRSLRGDTLDTKAAPASVKELWQQQRQAFAKEYREGLVDLIGDMPVDSVPDYSMRYESTQSVQLLCQSPQLLGLGFYGYEYSGGAHGGYGTEAASFDLRTGRRLRFADIFRPGADAALLPILDRTVRRALKIKPTEPLSEQLLVDTMTVTHNACLTPGGVLFIYEPYEIASYAQGEVRLFVPLAELRPLLRPNLPVAGEGRGVAAR